VTVLWTDAATADLDAILEYTSKHFRESTSSLEARFREVIRRIGHWPQSSRSVAGTHDIRTAPVPGYPFRIFYRVHDDRVVILHVRHAARQEWPTD
jgi:plasmid stabilization system protein ParE